MRTLVISAFPACGKSYCVENYSDKFDMIDSDSSEFSWLKDSSGKNTKERNPEFPNNYMEHIKNNIGNKDIIFVSSHKNVRDALNANKIKHIVIYPDIYAKDDWVKRMKKRGSDEKFIKFISDNWEKFINEIEEECKNSKKVKQYYYKLKEDEYIDDVLLYFLMALN